MFFLFPRDSAGVLCDIGKKGSKKRHGKEVSTLLLMCLLLA